MAISKLRFKAQISRTTDIAPKVLNDRIIEQLQVYSYQLTNATDFEVAFSGRNSSRMELARWSGTKLDEGKLEVDTLDNITTVKLTYYIHYTGFIVALGILLIYMCFVDFFAGFMLIFLLAGLLMHLSLQKGAAKELMEVILK